MHRLTRLSRLGGWQLLLLAAVSCGTASSGRALSAVGDVTGRMLSGSGSRERPSAWSMDSARCGVFRDHRIACPVLRNCAALLGSAESPLTVNVCVDEMGDLDPVKWCSYGGHWCRASAFPSCASAMGWSCDDFSLLVCEDDRARMRILRSQISPLSGGCALTLAPLHEVGADGAAEQPPDGESVEHGGDRPDPP